MCRWRSGFAQNGPHSLELSTARNSLSHVRWFHTTVTGCTGPGCRHAGRRRFLLCETRHQLASNMARVFCCCHVAFTLTGHRVYVAYALSYIYCTQLDNVMRNVVWKTQPPFPLHVILFPSQQLSLQHFSRTRRLLVIFLHCVSKKFPP